MTAIWYLYHLVHNQIDLILLPGPFKSSINKVIGANVASDHNLNEPEGEALLSQTSNSFWFGKAARSKFGNLEAKGWGKFDTLSMVAGNIKKKIFFFKTPRSAKVAKEEETTLDQ